MTAALVKISAGVATVYTSGDLSALADVKALSSIVITKNADTPAGDSVVVDLSSPIAGVNALNLITVENGATAKVGGGLVNVNAISALKTNGGILDLKASLVGVSALQQIYVGPSGGQITMEPTRADVGVLSVPVIFLNKAGRPTTTIPKDFVMDFPQVSKPWSGDKHVTARYYPLTHTTTIGTGFTVAGLADVGRVMTLTGDPFDIKNTGTFHLFGSYYSKQFKQDDGKSGIITCFLTGSMIRTTTGEVAVEDVHIGDEVIAFDWRNNTDIVRPVVWVGKAHVNVRHGLPDDEAGWPVRILKDAIADGVPYKDMLITSEHCLFFKDRFVPVRMLVNGVSIFYDKSISSYDYYHVETEQHSVITADGMLTESYLDTGNRASFRQEGKIATLRGAIKSWEDDAGAPLNVDRSFVEPLFRAIEWREDKVSKEQVPAAPELTNDPDMHLVTETGAVIRPMRRTSKEYSFMLPPGTQSVHIVSRASRPSDVIGPFVDDRRYMGVAVGEVRLICAKKQFNITSHLSTEKPQGWHADMGWQGAAWTDGNATLPLGDLLKHGKMGILSVSVLAAGPYLKNETKTVTVTVRSA